MDENRIRKGPDKRLPMPEKISRLERITAMAYRGWPKKRINF